MKKSLVLIAVLVIVLPIVATWNSEAAHSIQTEEVHPLAPLTEAE